MDFKKGMLGKFVSNKQANLRKGKGKQKKNKETPHRVFCKKGLMDKKHMKNGYLKGKTKAKKTK